MNKWYYLILFLIAFTGCANKPEIIEPKVDKPTAKTPPPIFGKDTQPTNIPTDITLGIEPDTIAVSTPPEEKTIYFDYDMASIKISAQIILNKHTDYLTENPDVIVRLEGHADERGSTEYNLALGELRAVATKEELISNGIPEDQIDTLSYGEEQPIISGHGEESWQLNRRVELVYE
ncbi:MAG: OmpA family protein [Candidatus Marithrix sp.]